jgi:hypothetical protein
MTRSRFERPAAVPSPVEGRVWDRPTRQVVFELPSPSSLEGTEESVVFVRSDDGRVEPQGYEPDVASPDSEREPASGPITLPPLPVLHDEPYADDPTTPLPMLLLQRRRRTRSGEIALSFGAQVLAALRAVTRRGSGE